MEVTCLFMTLKSNCISYIYGEISDLVMLTWLHWSVHDKVP